MTTPINYSINVPVSIQCLRVGSEQEKVLVIDNFMKNAEMLVNIAADKPFIPYHSLYPGIKLPAPVDYTRELLEFVVPIIEDHYQLPEKRVMQHAECLFSLVTRKENELHLFQRAPHRDSSYEYQFAILLYLCGQEHGGTAFYRHNLTDYEAITRSRSDAYDKAYFEDLQKNGEPAARYQIDTDRRYTKIAAINAQFNRLIIYRSCLLHAPFINLPKSIDPNPHTGRLTLNSFIAFFDA
ncbi:MAG TPA: DUF6445 family protein [Cellvibrio sp.]